MKPDLSDGPPGPRRSTGGRAWRTAAIALVASAALLDLWIFPAVAHSESIDLGALSTLLRNRYGWPDAFT